MALRQWRQKDGVQGQSWLHNEFNHILHFGVLDGVINVMSEAFPSVFISLLKKAKTNKKTEIAFYPKPCSPLL